MLYLLICLIFNHENASQKFHDIKKKQRKQCLCTLGDSRQLYVSDKQRWIFHFDLIKIDFTQNSFRHSLIQGLRRPFMLSCFETICSILSYIDLKFIIIFPFIPKWVISVEICWNSFLHFLSYRSNKIKYFLLHVFQA